MRRGTITRTRTREETTWRKHTGPLVKIWKDLPQCPPPLLLFYNEGLVGFPMFSAGNHLFQHQFKFIPVVPHAVAAVHPQLPRRNDGIGTCVSNVLHVPVANYPGAIIPSMIHPLCFLQRPPMLPPPDCYVRCERNTCKSHLSKTTCFVYFALLLFRKFQ